MRTDPLYQQKQKQHIFVEGVLLGEVYYYNEKVEDRNAAIDYTRKKVVAHGEEQRNRI